MADEMKSLEDYKDYELYAELKRRGIYDVYEVNIHDLERYDDVNEWARNEDKVDELMAEWSEMLIDYMDPDDQVSDMLYEAAEKLGFTPEE